MTEIHVGDLFPTFSDFETKLQIYKQANLVDFYISDSRTLESARKRCPILIEKIPEAVKYYYVKFRCVRGGVFKRRNGYKGMRKTSSLKQDCKALINLKVDESSCNLIVSQMIDIHDHEISEALFHHLPKQRRLSPENKEEISELLQLKTIKKMVLEKVVETTGKPLSLLDLSNTFPKSDFTLLRKKLKRNSTTSCESAKKDENEDVMLDADDLLSRNEMPEKDVGTQSLKMDNLLSPGFAHFIRILSVESENDKILEQDSEPLYKTERDNDDSEEEMSAQREDHDSSLDERLTEEVPETEAVTYLVCDINQQLSDFTRDHPFESSDSVQQKKASEINIIEETPFIPKIVQIESNVDENEVSKSENFFENNSVTSSDSVQQKKTSEINCIVQEAPLMPKIVQIESRVEEDELTKSEILNRLSILERKVEKLHEQSKNDKKRIKILEQSQYSSAKEIAALKDSITTLKQSHYKAHAKSEILKDTSPSFMELFDKKKCESKDKRYSLEMHKFVKNLYSISPDAYKYVRNYFDATFPDEKTILKWTHKGNQELNFNSEKESNVINLTGDCIDIKEEEDDF